MDIDAYVPGKSAAPAGVAKVHKLSSNENPLGASPKAIEAVQRRCREARRSIPTARPRGCARRSPRCTGSTRANIVCSNGSDEILGLLAQTYLAPGDEASSPSTASWSTRSTSRRPARVPVVGQGDRRARRCRCDPRRGDAAHQDRLPRQSQQPDRHLSAVRGGAPAACRPAADTCCWCSTRPMPNMSAATTTRPASSWSSSSQNVVMTRTFSKIYGLGGAAHRLDVCAGRTSSMR